jgi:branched-subunit amino acid ABC-type transport system permease component
MPSFTELAQALVDGLAVGSSYAILALAFTILWATVRTVNLALLQIVAVGGLVAYEFAGSGVVVAFTAAIVASLVLALASHLIAVQSTISKGLLYPIIASLGVGLLLQAAMTLTAGDDVRVMPDLLPTGVLEVGGVFIGWTPLIVFAITGGFLVAAGLIARFTTLGLSFRAAAWQPQLAMAYGVNVRWVRLISAGAAGVAAGLAGACAGILAGSVSPFTGAATGLNGLVGMLIGGAGNPVGAVLGGLLVGVLQALGAVFVSSSMQGVISLSLLFLIMILRPSGLMKER